MRSGLAWLCALPLAGCAEPTSEPIAPASDSASEPVSASFAVSTTPAPLETLESPETRSTRIALAPSPPSRPVAAARRAPESWLTGGHEPASIREARRILARISFEPTTPEPPKPREPQFFRSSPRWDDQAPFHCGYF